MMDEFGRILDKGNPRFIPKLKARWENFYSKAQFYGVYKKVLKPPMTLDGGKLLEDFKYAKSTNSLLYIACCQCHI